MTAATHLNIEPTDTITVLHDGRVRITGDGYSHTFECRDAGTAHRLEQAFSDVREAMALRKEHRVAVLNGNIA